MGAVERVAKNGVNQFHKYSYATEADITQAVRGEMAAQGLMMVPTVEKLEWAEVLTGAGKKERLCTASYLFTILDADSDAKIEFRNVGQGQDSGDKAAYKAATGAVKYALLKLFLIPTGDDPENEKAESKIPPPAGVDKLRQQIAQTAPAHWESGPPPHTDADAPDAGGLPQRSHEDLVMGKFGNGAGKRLSELDDNSVSFYRGACRKTLADPTKEKWHAAETLRLVAFDAELRFRGLPV